MRGDLSSGRRAPGRYFPAHALLRRECSGHKNVIHAAEKNNISKIIFTSSFAVYGLDAKTPDENSAPAPFNDYGKSKLEAEDALKDWAAQDPARSLTIVRPVVVFGEGNRGNVYTLIRQISAGKFVMIGQGENRKSMAYVENVAAFLKFCLHEKPGVQIYNYADKPDYRTKELTDVVYAALGKRRAPCAFLMPLGCWRAIRLTFWRASPENLFRSARCASGNSAPIRQARRKNAARPDSSRNFLWKTESPV